MSIDIEVNVAATLREIAANCDTVTGKILRQVEKAARKGASHLVVSVSEEDAVSLLHRLNRVSGHLVWKEITLTPLIEKLYSLGFILNNHKRSDFWQDYQIDISW
jgi:hypothetical protein